MFYELKNENDTLPNSAVTPVVTEYDKMVYLALSEYFFDSGLDSYFKVDMFKTEISNGRVSKAIYKQCKYLNHCIQCKIKICRGGSEN